MKRCYSSGTPCNRCVLEKYQRSAKESGYIVTLRPKPTANFPAGQDVFVHPVNLPEDEISKWRVDWLGEIPNYCLC